MLTTIRHNYCQNAGNQFICSSFRDDWLVLDQEGASSVELFQATLLPWSLDTWTDLLSWIIQMCSSNTWSFDDWEKHRPLKFVLGSIQPGPWHDFCRFKTKQHSNEWYLMLTVYSILGQRQRAYKNHSLSMGISHQVVNSGMTQNRILL